jgi:hypothetical protein
MNIIYLILLILFIIYYLFTNHEYFNIDESDKIDYNIIHIVNSCEKKKII